MSRRKSTAFERRGRPVQPEALGAYEAASGATITVWLDVEITRRKTYHLIVDENGRSLWRAYRFSDVLEWLRSRGVEEYTVTTDGAKWQARLAVAFERKD
jgi:hypothetical protein